MKMTRFLLQPFYTLNKYLAMAWLADISYDSSWISAKHWLGFSANHLNGSILRPNIKLKTSVWKKGGYWDTCSSPVSLRRLSYWCSSLGLAFWRPLPGSDVINGDDEAGYGCCCCRGWSGDVIGGGAIILDFGSPSEPVTSRRVAGGGGGNIPENP